MAEVDEIARDDARASAHTRRRSSGQSFLLKANGSNFGVDVRHARRRSTTRHGAGPVRPTPSPAKLQAELYREVQDATVGGVRRRRRWTGWAPPAGSR